MGRFHRFLAWIFHTCQKVVVKYPLREGELLPIGIGRRKCYRLSDLRRFLGHAAKQPQIAVPWRNGESNPRARTMGIRI